ncbi:MAG: phenylalanine--tRNA ligase subunit beta [Deltaproteobacteria bacterium HGW-Deltaproteobacteria-14]|jgi:phenylalanyl-tRNA synthetase beta chain|nr:MAG: phenylalanine--tRNA ligase subunit beta [Deltaproteobacteria bacterium HGW-Deltaproteobacteria-14]
MYISTNWLGRHVDLTGVDLDVLAKRFTLAVAELEGVHRVGADLGPNVVVGRVLEVNAIEGKHVRVTRVDTGAHGVRTIVCGAPNVAAGQDVVVALPGAKLGELEIAVATVAGVESHGMIASERELGLSEEHAGILVLDGAPAAGTVFADAYPVVDTLFEVDNKSLTHRPDLWGHRGIAREVAALLGRELLPQDLEVAFTDARPLTIRVDDPTACPRYSAVCLDGVTIAPSPLWLRLLLARVGTRPISNVVDATNFVMLDTGNPLHAFDARQISGAAIVVRRAGAGEAFTTLDGQRRALDATDLLIADADRGVALAGVMGGENSEIKDDTTAMVLEAANFDAAVIRVTAQRLGIRTESSARFEKSLDPHLVEDASRAFCRLVLTLCPGARVTSAFMDVAAPYAAPTHIRLPVALVERRLGAALGAARIREILTGLDFAVSEPQPGIFDVIVPSWRATKDIGIKEDLIEEVGRIHGYDNITPEPPEVKLIRPDANARKRFEHAVRGYLTQTGGLDELQTYSFDFEPLLARIGVTPGERLTLKNPISAEMPALRRSLVPGLLGAAEKNTRGFDGLRFFEVGRVYHPHPSEVADQPVMLAGLVAELPDGPTAATFFELRDALAGLARAIDRTPLTVRGGGVSHAWAHPVRQATLSLAGVVIGHLAEVHPAVAMKLELRQQAAVFELDLDVWRRSEALPPSYEPLPRFPSVFRDFAVIVQRNIAAADVQAAIAAAAPDRIKAVAFQSVYTGAGVPEGHKSMAWSVTLRHPERTLADPEVREVEASVWRSLAERVDGRPRA